jgi:hypothetical protein
MRSIVPWMPVFIDVQWFLYHSLPGCPPLTMEHRACPIFPLNHSAAADILAT